MTVSPIRLALGEHLGRVLTPELACQIEASVIGIQVDKSIQPIQFGKFEYGNYSIQAEKFIDVLPELERLHAAQWAETEKARLGVAMNPNYAYMAEQERAGQLLQFTARDSDTWELVGNMRVYLYRDLHARQLTAKEDTFFVMPEHRGGFLAVRLWQFAEKSAVSIGVREVRFSSKLVNKADRMAKYLKYRPIGTEFIKVFNEIGQPVKE